jgi:hypothetical protein
MAVAHLDNRLMVRNNMRGLLDKYSCFGKMFCFHLQCAGPFCPEEGATLFPETPVAIYKTE